MTYRLTSGLLALAAAMAISNFSPVAKADEWDKQTAVTFSGAVDVPGKQLAPGTYIFRLFDSNADRDIVQVYTKDGEHLVTQFKAIPASRTEPANGTIITLEDESKGGMEAVKSWYYPGDADGLEFIYGK